MEITFRGKRVVVTGAGRGIGRGLAEHLAKDGAQVVAIGRTQAHLDSLKAAYPTVETITVDLTDWAATRKALEHLGHVDALVNNAGIAELTPFLDATPDQFDRTFGTNVKAAMNVSQIVAKEWVASGSGGAIVNVSSQAAIAGFKNHAVYCASKAALDAMSRVMAIELAPYHVRVNCVNPTVILTDMAKIGWSDPVKASSLQAQIPMARFGQVQEVIDVVLYLLSDKASLITGVQLPVDGGYLAT